MYLPWGDRVDIRGQVVAWKTHILLHELGHGIGLGHVEDESSVMDPSPSVSWPSPSDVAMARDLLGC